jgi:hypothetical protein
MAPGGAAATGTKGPRQATGRKKKIYTTCFLSPSSVLKQSSSCTSLLLLLFSLDLSPFLERKQNLLSWKPLENRRVHRKGTEEEMTGNMNSVYFQLFFFCINIENLANFSSQKKKKQQKINSKTSPILFYTTQEKPQMFFFKKKFKIFSKFFLKKMTKFVQKNIKLWMWMFCVSFCL